MKKVFISGITGQDGAWLAKLLIEKGYKVYGGVRDKNKILDWRLTQLGILESIEFRNFNLTDSEVIATCIKEIQPDEFYNLAAQSSVAESYETPIETSLVDGMSVLYILDAIKKSSPHTKFFQASSSEIFGNAKVSPQTEDTNIQPASPYAVAKSYAHWMNISYRNSFSLFCVNGILYGHESELRSENFFTRKVSLHIANWFLGNKKVLEVGNLEAEKDWGHAKEYVEGMYLSLQTQTPEDYIFATGNKIKIKNFIEHSFGLIDINLAWEGKDMNVKAYDSKTGELILKANPNFYRPIEINTACGNANKAKNILNWSPKIDYKELSKIMVHSDINKLRHV
ncbi:MAG: GDP-mannose 4,6-dehydratase [Leptospiraceae bacterium]|nr:GDP-mannose 4,6-dehydratase [Leptospiraceae bacterium]